ncbi:MAG: serine/threonine-protein kinase [Myxococcales bacterium]
MTNAIVPRCVGRYCIGPEIASGGMATIRLGQLEGPGGFRRLVAIKQLNAELAAEPGLSALLIEEARLTSAISHPNVVSIFDVLEHDGELMLVMDYVNGETLAQLLRQARKRQAKAPVPVVRRIISDVLHGLHAAHTATDVEGLPLRVVHRDVSPQNIMVGVDGVARVLDFGVAKAALGANYTAPGQVKGKLAYMAPEQLREQAVDARTDLFAAGIVLWEALSGRRLFVGRTASQLVSQLLSQPISRLNEERSDISPELDQLLEKALARAPSERFANAQAFADALEATGPLASRPEVAAWIRDLVGPTLAQRGRSCAELGADTVRMQLVAPSRPSRGSAVHRWLRRQAGGRARMHAAGAAVLIALACCLVLLISARTPESPLVRSEMRPSAPLNVTSPVPALFAAGPCTGVVRHAAAHPAGTDSLGPPPLRPESLRLEGSPRVRRSKLGTPSTAPRPPRTVKDVLGF